MAEEESFVILGSSPMPSLCPNGNSLLHDALDNEDKKPTGEDLSAHTENVAASINLEHLSVSPQLTSSKESSLPTTLPSQPTSMAASFILGDLKPDVLKNSVYSQFPSLCSMQACAEDVVKLQTMMTEYLALKTTLDKLNYTIQEYYKITNQWRQEAAEREKQYQEKLQQCQTHIDHLNQENQRLKREVDSHFEQMRLVEDIRQKEHDELRQSVSEKSSLISNMRVEIDKLNQQQLHSFEYVPGEEKPADVFVQHNEHEKQIKELQRQLSGLLAENLEINDMKNTYIEEITCLKVNLTSAEELLKKNRAEINELKAKDAQTDEEITHLKSQIEIYRRDFEMERADREKNASEKEQYMLDLRSLQRRNQELIEALSEAHKGRTSGPATNSPNRTILRDDQRPVRVLDPTGSAAKTADVLRCPICSKSFTALTVLQSHVNDCLDKN